MSKHTPGPWLGRSKSDSVHRPCDTHPYGDQIFAFHPDYAPNDADHALILAAPELLAALEQVNDCLVKCLTGGEVSAKLAGKAIENAAIVIAQAKGEQP
jgi:hypothetical protein